MLSSTHRLVTDSPNQLMNPNFLSRTSVSGTIPKSKRFEMKVLITPGPGSYNINRLATASSTVFSKTKRETLEKYPETPGPGLYNMPKLPTGPKYTLCSRTVSKSPVSPGPGSYNISTMDKPRLVTFSKSERKIVIGRSDTPGPGHYNSLSSLIRSTGSFTKAKRDIKKINNNIGPGCYETFQRGSWKFALSKQIRRSPF